MIRGLLDLGVNDTKARYLRPGCATNIHRSDLLRLVCNQVPYANFGDAAGLQPSAVDGGFYLSLHTSDPGLDGNQDTNEINYPGYTRILGIRDNVSNNRIVVGSAQSVSADNVLLFYPSASIFGGANSTYWPLVGATPNKYVVTHIGFGTDASGPGYLVGYGSMTKPMPLKEGIGFFSDGGPYLLVF